MNKLKSLSVFFPCLNDAKSIPSLLKKTYEVLPKITSDYEVMIIDDGSTDETPEVLEKLRTKYKNLRIVRNQKPSGYGGALIKGFGLVKKEWVFYTDGDGQYDPTELFELVKKAKPEIDVVNGYKLGREDSIPRRVGGFLYNRILHLLYPIPIRDVDCDFRLIRNSLLRQIKLNSKSGAICLELVMKLKNHGAKFSEVPIHHYARKHGKSTFFKLPNLVRTFSENIKLYKEIALKK